MDHPSPTDQELIAAARQGDRDAYGDLVARYWEAVVGVVYRMCGDGGVAEEAAQEAFLRAWRRLGSYRPEHSFRSWVYRIALNAAIDELRRGNRWVTVEEASLPDRADGPEQAYQRRELAERVQEAILSLPPAGRAALILREYEGLAYREIAEALEIPIGTVMSRLNSARGQLRRILAGQVEVV